MRVTLFTCILTVIINNAFLSCKNNTQDTPYNTKAELTEWIKLKVIKYIKDSVSAKSVEINEWTYIATANVDSIKDIYIRNGLFDNNDREDTTNLKSM